MTGTVRSVDAAVLETKVKSMCELTTYLDGLRKAGVRASSVER